MDEEAAVEDGGMGIPVKVFPECFPVDFADRILPKGLVDMEIDVFRVCINGTINKETFYSTFELTHLGIRPTPCNWEKKLEQPGTYSVSCNDTLGSCRNALKCLVDHHPAAFLIQGTATSALGPMQRTVDRDPHYQDPSHIDWWLFADSDPSPMFHKFEETP